MLKAALIGLMGLGLSSGCTAQAPVGADAYEAVLSQYDDDPHGDLQSVVIIRGEDLIAERYYNGADRHTLTDVRSAGKSVTAMVFGLAHDAGLVADVNDPVSVYWSEAAGHPAGDVRLADLLTMRSGLDADADNPSSPGYEDYLDESEDTTEFALSVPSAETPGETYRYNSLAAYLVGRVIDEAAGDETMGEYARAHLFDPLEIEDWDWMLDQSGFTKGQGNLFISGLGFARLGQLVLNDGRYQGRQIISEDWIEAMLAPSVDVRDSLSNAEGYGYFWYIQNQPVGERTTPLFFASGNGGNKIYILPEFDLVVSVQSRAYGQGRGHRRSDAILADILALEPLTQ